jgi:hypothetical protein
LQNDNPRFTSRLSILLDINPSMGPQTRKLPGEIATFLVGLGSEWEAFNLMEKAVEVSTGQELTLKVTAGKLTAAPSLRELDLQDRECR